MVLTDDRAVDVQGTAAAGAVPALALTCVVLTGALALAGPVFRVVLGVLETALGILVVVSAVVAVLDPVSSSTASISAVTGVTGSESVAALVASVSVALWPVVAIVAGAVIAGLGVVVVATASRWPSSARKYAAVRMEPADGDRIGDWDALTRGDDPT
jgi:hypothetical protein